MEGAGPEVEVTLNGPYTVSGDVPIRPKCPVVSEHGEPLAWQTVDSAVQGRTTDLCRCGHSAQKPFCDGSHVAAPFDGTEVASREPWSARRSTHEAVGITVHHDGPLCEHARFCVNRTTSWRKMLPNTSDIGVRGQLMGMIQNCPSGALACAIDGETIEPDLPIGISPIEDGPLWVTGNVTIISSDGTPLETRNRVTLCRCGHSKNKPLCDGTHEDIGFKAKFFDTAADTSRQIATPRVNRRRDSEAALFGQVVLADDPATLGTLGIWSVAETLARRASSEVQVKYTLGDVVEELDAGLIVVARDGDRLPRKHRRLARRSPCDLLVAGEAHDPEHPYRRILIATDGSTTADRAARRGYGLARVLDASVELVCVGHPATGELVSRDTIAVYGEGVASEVRLLRGNPVRRILGAAASSGADLIVVGNKGMTRAGSFLRSSVPQGVLEGADCDVLLCRTVRQIESELEPGEGGVIERHGEPMAVFVDHAGELHRMSARCPHLGCVVTWNPAERTFDCPCHMSRFGPLGELMQGPATRPLPPA